MPILKIFAEARDKGLRRSAGVGISVLRTQATLTSRKVDRRFLFVSHTIDNSGAPFVLMQIVADFAQHYDPSRLHVVAPEIRADQLRLLEATGVRIDRTAIPGNRLVGLQLGMRRDDFVLINTTAVREPYQRYILKALRTGHLNHAFWFIHEELQQLHKSAPFVLEQSMIDQITLAVSQRSLTIVVPSERSKNAYDQLFQTSNTVILPPRVDVGDQYCRPRLSEEYGRIDFLIVGATEDGRKGQLFTIAALQDFLITSGGADPRRYRDFTLTLVGVGDDYLSRQVKTIGTAMLGDRLRTMPKVSRDEVFSIARECNVVVCSSLNETFALYVAEGMAMGHVVLRNETGGMEEELRPGVNGYRIDISSIEQFAGVVETVLNRETTSNERLQEMGRASQEMIESYRHLSYVSRLESIDTG
jgi:glycosyltransferase involved in cell wall biosynthesis